MPSDRIRVLNWTCLLAPPCMLMAGCAGGSSPPTAESSERVGPAVASGPETGEAAPDRRIEQAALPDRHGFDSEQSLRQATTGAHGADFDPSLSPDGKWLAFASTQHHESAEIYVKSVNGRTVTQLTANPAADVMPSYSPDGKRIAFASDRDGSFDVWVMSAKGGQAVQVTNDSADDLHPSWSPDGKSVVFCRLGQASGRWELWTAPLGSDDGAPGEFIGFGMFPEWCPKAACGESGRDRILFQRPRERDDRAFSVWMVDYKPGDVSSPTEVFSSATEAAINPTWSPDGEFIAFSTTAIGAKAGSGESSLWVCSVAGGDRVGLAGSAATGLAPCWGTDGRVYFVANNNGASNIWSVGTEQAMLAFGGGLPETANDGTAAAEAESDPGRSVATVPEESQTDPKEQP